MSGSNSYSKNFLQRVTEALTEDIVIEIMAALGTPLYRKKDNELWFRTVCHGGDSHKLCYYKDSHSFYCYTSCGKMSVFQLIQNTLKCSFQEAVTFLSRKTHMSIRQGFQVADTSITNEIKQMDRYLKIRGQAQAAKATISLPVYDATVLNNFDDSVFYKGWIEEGITVDTQREFGIRWYEMDKYIIIPHYNVKGELVGVRRRSLQRRDAKNKYMPLIYCGQSYNHPLSNNLYGIDKHYKAIKSQKKAMIVESEKSVMLAHEYYGDNAFVVASCGFNISEWQRNALLSMGIEEIILAFDKDYDPVVCDDIESPYYQQYQNYMNRVLNMAEKFTPFCRTYVLWDDMGVLNVKDSPLDCGKEKLEILMRNKIEVNTIC